MKGWHIRLCQKVGTVETWRLYKDDTPQSSPMPKEIVAAWCADELRREAEEKAEEDA